MSSDITQDYLNKKIKEMGGQSSLAKELSITQPALSNKLRGHSPWKNEEIKIVSQTIGIDEKDLRNLFRKMKKNHEDENIRSQQNIIIEAFNQTDMKTKLDEITDEKSNDPLSKKLTTGVSSRLEPKVKLNYQISIAVCIIAFVSLCFIVYGFLGPKREKIFIYAGSEHGTYYKFAESLKSILKNKYDIKVEKSYGSIDNISSLTRNKNVHAIGFAQADVVKEFTSENNNHSLRLIAPIYIEYCSLLAEGEIKELKGKKINLGEYGSGIYNFATKHIIISENKDSSRVKLSGTEIEATVQNLSIHDAVKSKQSNAIFSIIKHPVKSFQRLNRNKSYRFLAITIEEYGDVYQAVAFLPNKYYSSLECPNIDDLDISITTTAIPCFMLTNSNMPIEVTKNILKAINKNLDSLTLLDKKVYNSKKNYSFIKKALEKNKK